MFPPARLLPFCLGLVFAGPSGLVAAAADTYQVTGPVLALTASTITVQKNDEKWEIARDPNAKGDSTLKVGDRVTVHYRMVATRVEANPSKSTGDAKGSDAHPAASSAKDKKATGR